MKEKSKRTGFRGTKIIFAFLIIISVLGAVVIIGAGSSNSNNFFGSTYKITDYNAQYIGNPAASTATYVVYATVQNDGNSGLTTFNCTLKLSDLSTVSSNIKQ